MRKFLFFLVLLFGVSAMAQSLRKPFEASAGLGIFTNVNTVRYHPQVLSNKITRDLSANEFSKQHWNPERTTIREYSIGGSLLIGQSRKLDKEWIFNLELSGQFQHHYIFSGQSETILENMIIDSVNSVRTYEKRYINITEVDDIIFIKPSVSWKYHLNRRFNLRMDGGLGLGIPVKAGFEIIEYVGRIEKTYRNQQQTNESSLQDGEDLSTSFIQGPFYLALNTSIKSAIEYRLYEYRSIFLSCAAVVGRQMHFHNGSNRMFHYSGGEFKIVSRF